MMRNVVNNYIKKFKHEKQVRRRFISIITALALVVSCGVFWQLRSDGVAMANEVFCGQEEHTHGEECYEKVLTCELEEGEPTEGHTHDESCYETVTEVVCGLEESEGHTHGEECYDEEGNLVCELEESEGHTHTDECYETTQTLICELEESEASEGHTHTDECYEEQLICEIPEHTHTIACMSDETADLETALDWEKTLPDEEDLTGVWAEDVVTIAKSQLGYTESSRNFVVSEDNNKQKGYTRYGAWYGDPYGDWCAMFASFCLHYAGVPEDKFPEDEGCWAWTVKLNKLGLYEDVEDSDYVPVPGDLVFFNSIGDNDKDIDHVGIVEEVKYQTNEIGEEVPVKLVTIEGNSSNMVERNTYDLTYEKIVGYGVLPEQPDLENEDDEETDEADEAEEADETDEEETVLWNGVLEGEGDFTYEDENLTMNVHVSGTIVISEEEEAEEGEEAGEAEEVVEAGEAGEAVEAVEADEVGEAVEAEAVVVEADAVDVEAEEAYAAAEAAVGTNLETGGGEVIAEAVVEEAPAEDAAYDAVAAEAPAEDAVYDAEVTEAVPVTDASLAKIAVISDTETADIEAEDADDVEDAVSWDDIKMEVTFLNADSEAYVRLLSYAEENGMSENFAPIGMNISFYYNDEKLDMSDCDITADITLSEGLFSELSSKENVEDAAAEEDADADSNADADSEADADGSAEDADGSAEGDAAAGEDDYVDTNTASARTVSVTLSVVDIADEEVDELDSVTVEADEDIPTVEVAVVADEDYGIMLLDDADPYFTVQFYANIDQILTVSKSGDEELTVIETSGGNLPKNGSTPTTSVVELSPVGNGYVLDSNKVLTEMYKAENYEWNLEPDLEHMNKLEKNGDYVLYEIWKLKGNDETSTNRDDWEIYTYTDGMDFTNNSGDTSKILVSDGDVFRFVYNTSESDATVVANFYDYNITDGKVYSSNSTSSSAWTSGTRYIYTYDAGINGATTTGSGTRIAFGNNNTGMKYQDDGWANNGTNYPNKYNSNGFYGCTFSLVTGLDSDGHIIYNSGLAYPNLFNEGSASGKTEFANGFLTYSREGDTYTLTAATLQDGTGANNLDTFYHPGGYTSIYSNNFWPLDGVSYDGMDIEFGNSSDLPHHFGDGTGDSQWMVMPASDDGTDHNSYFGMNFDVDFDLTADYVGPLEYFFFGDDDMWVFLTDPNGNSQLVIDIGGVHSSVGEHVNLWDYIPKGSTGSYTLSVFYTERGASGSTCYIRYTLPTVSSSTIVEDAGNLEVKKQVDGVAVDSEKEFEFTLKLTDADGDELTNLYAYEIYKDNDFPEVSGTIKSGDTFKLQDGYYIIVENLPNGTIATVTENSEDGYSTTYQINSGETVGGTTASAEIEDGQVTTILFINITSAELPMTGGAGTIPFTAAGVGIIGFAGYFLLRNRRRNERPAA